MTYQQAARYLASFINYENIRSYRYNKSCKLSRIKSFLCLLGNPQDSFKSIHVAGTKGKGSTCAFISYILKEAGFKVGLYTSPHLTDFRERIRILPGRKEGGFEGMITKEELTRLVVFLKPLIKEYNRKSKLRPLTFFEVYTALAFLYFKNNSIDFAVLETGLGGRLDATNAVDSELCVITPISYEHTDKLGKTLKRIAYEKAGIIKKNGAIVVIAPQEEEALSALRLRCGKFNAKLFEVKKIQKFKIRLIGEHQLVNAAVAVKAVLSLKINPGIEVIKKGLYNTSWPGRCEILKKKPFVVIDGAQNVASIKALIKAIRDNFNYDKIILIIGLSSDKDIAGISRIIRGFADNFIITKAKSKRAMDTRIIAGYLRDKNYCITESVREAKEKAMRLAGKNDLILVTGSLFVVGEFRGI